MSDKREERNATLQGKSLALKKSQWERWREEEEEEAGERALHWSRHAQ